MFKKIGLLFILSAIISCNFHIEKRKYFKGYHVEIAKSQKPIPQKNDIAFPDQKECNPSKKFDSEPFEASSNGITESVDNLTEYSTLNDFKKDSHTKKLNTEKQTDFSVFKTSSSAKKPQSQIKKNRKKKNWDDFYLIGLFAIIGLSTIVLAKKFQYIILSISNWASKNKFKTKVLIGILQTGIALLGIGIGTNLNDLGYTFSTNSSYLFSGILLLAIITLIKQKKASRSEPLKSFFRNKMTQAAIALSSLMLMTVVGNNIGMNNPTDSPVGYIIEKNHFGLIDKENTSSSHYDSIATTEKETRIDKATLVALYVFLAILMAIVLMALTCAVWCWAVLSAEVGVIVIAVVATIFMVLLAIYVISSMRRSIDKNEASETPL